MRTLRRQNERTTISLSGSACNGQDASSARWTQPGVADVVGDGTLIWHRYADIDPVDRISGAQLMLGTIGTEVLMTPVRALGEPPRFRRSPPARSHALPHSAAHHLQVRGLRRRVKVERLPPCQQHHIQTHRRMLRQPHERRFLGSGMVCPSSDSAGSASSADWAGA